MHCTTQTLKFIIFKRNQACTMLMSLKYIFSILSFIDFSRIMYSVLSGCPSILLLGEANFSFSLSLRKLLPPSVAMVTSCLQSEEKISTENPNSKKNVDALREMGTYKIYYLFVILHLQNQQRVALTQFYASAKNN